MDCRYGGRPVDQPVCRCGGKRLVSWRRQVCNGERPGSAGRRRIRSRPMGRVTRGMLVTVLWRAEQEPAAASAMTFADVDPDAYYARLCAGRRLPGVRRAAVRRPLRRRSRLPGNRRRRSWNGMPLCGAHSLEMRGACPRLPMRTAFRHGRGKAPHGLWEQGSCAAMAAGCWIPWAASPVRKLRRCCRGFWRCDRLAGLRSEPVLRGVPIRPGTAAGKQKRTGKQSDNRPAAGGPGIVRIGGITT